MRLQKSVAYRHAQLVKISICFVAGNFEKEFTHVNRVLVPAQSDWRLAGEVLSLIGQKYGFDQVGRARMTNDALIAMSVARTGLTVLTKNPGDFKKIAEFRPFSWEELN